MNTTCRIFTLILIVCVCIMPNTIRADQDCAAGLWQVNDQCVDPADIKLKDGWNAIEPGGMTACAHGTPYVFWMRPGSDNLLVSFQGGGGCWSAETCKKGSSWYNQSADPQDIYYGNEGIFDLDNPQNPFADYTFVVAPSCTGDVYMGSNIATYTNARGGNVTVHHHGFINGSAVMDWIYATVKQPESIFVTGCSAGSVGSAIFAPRLIEHYPGVPVRQLGDSLGAIFSQPNNLAADWGAQPSIPEWMTDVSADSFTMTAYYQALAKQFPDQSFGQFNSQFDNVQQRYFAIGQGDPKSIVGTTINTAMREISQSAPNFRYFTEGGDIHCITPRDDFYTHAVGNITVRDWIADYAAGKPVESVQCEECEDADRVQR